MVSSIDAKVNARTKELKLGFKDYMDKQIPKMIDEYWKMCEEHSDLLYTITEKEEFLMECHNNIKKVLGIK